MSAATAAIAIATIATIAGPACGRDRPRASTTTLVVRVTDGGRPVAARVLLFDDHNEPVHIGSLDVYGARQGGAACKLAPAVIGSWDGLILGEGEAEVPIGADACRPSPAIPYGRYRVWAWRGIEYELWTGEVDLSARRGRVELAIELKRAWAPHGTLAADLHVHARASNDSNLPNPQRVIAQAAAGIQVIALSDHNTNGDLDAEIAELELGSEIASIASNEITTDAIHVGVYPVVVDRTLPRGGAIPESALARADARRIFELARALPGNPIVQVNHPRFRYTALYDSARWNGITYPPPFPIDFDAVEVIAGYSAFNVDGDRRLDDGVRDFYTLFDHGHLITPLGNSDTHDLNWVLDGTARTYVYVDAPVTQPFDEAAFIAAVRARRVVATTGPWLDVEVATERGATPTVGPGQIVRAHEGRVWLDVELAQAAFVKIERIRITVGSVTGPVLAHTIDVPPGVSIHRWSGAIEVGSADTWIGVAADGDTALPLPLTGTYQRDKWKRAGVTPFALASPVLIDADGDRRWVRGVANVPAP